MSFLNQWKGGNGSRNFYMTKFWQKKVAGWEFEPAIPRSAVRLTKSYAREPSCDKGSTYDCVCVFQPDMSKLSINPDKMWQEFVESMVLEITAAVKFCKKLPGKSPILLSFNSLSTSVVC